MSKCIRLQDLIEKLQQFDRQLFVQIRTEHTEGVDQQVYDLERIMVSGDGSIYLESDDFMPTPENYDIAEGVKALMEELDMPTDTEDAEALLTLIEERIDEKVYKL